MVVRATVLCENSVYGNTGAIAEHGWSVWIETEGGPFLFDTGQDYAFLNNAKYLGIAIADTQAILISHHHADHTGGLLNAIQEIGRHRAVGAGPIPIHGHPDLFKESYSKRGERLTYIGVPHNRAALETAGANFELQRHWKRVAPGLSMSGEIPRNTSFENGDQNLHHRDADGRLVVDPIRDDQTIVCETPEGLFIILGCSHAGLINILTYICEETGESRIHTIMGGTHLGPVGDEQVNETIEALHRFEIGRIGVSHCTGPRVAARMAREFGERFFFCSVGTVVEV